MTAPSPCLHGHEWTLVHRNNDPNAPVLVITCEQCGETREVRRD